MHPISMHWHCFLLDHMTEMGSVAKYGSPKIELGLASCPSKTFVLLFYFIVNCALIKILFFIKLFG